MQGGSGRRQGRGRGGGYDLGPGGDCICPNCSFGAPHQVGTPCYNQTCPKCGTMMTRAM